MKPVLIHRKLNIGGDDMDDEFSLLLKGCKSSIERFIYYKMPNKEDAEDILQEVLITGYRSFKNLESKEKFKSWMLSIARNKCNDFYRKGFKLLEVPFEEIYEYERSSSRAGISVKEVVSETLENLKDQDKSILLMHYIRGMDQISIAATLNIPLGTVKSRLFKARQNFKEKYPYPPDRKGENNMKKSKFPKTMPRIIISKSDLPEFEVRCEQDIGWFIVPRLGESSSFASYDFDLYPEMKKTSETSVKVIGKANIHGVECVEIEESTVEEDGKEYGFTIFERLTDTHLQTVGAVETDNDVKKISTFLDDDFLNFWGFGENNCGEEIIQKSRGIIEINDKGELNTKEVDIHNSDIVGRYRLKIGNKEYDTIRQVYFNTHGEIVENYISDKGQVVLFRRFNKFDWRHQKGYDELWTEKFPNSDRLVLNGDVYVHWYNCLPDYVLE